MLDQFRLDQDDVMMVFDRLYNGKAAEQELKSLQDQTTSSFTFGKDLIKHNLVVFRNGEGALQVFLQPITTRTYCSFLDPASTSGCHLRGQTEPGYLLPETG